MKTTGLHQEAGNRPKPDKKMKKFFPSPVKIRKRTQYAGARIKLRTKKIAYRSRELFQFPFGMLNLKSHVIFKKRFSRQPIPNSDDLKGIEAMELGKNLGPPDKWSEIVAKAKEGDPDALGLLLDYFQKYLYTVVNNDLDSDLQPKMGGSDVVQNTFIEASLGFPRFKGETKAELKAWLVSILKNNLHDCHRFFHEVAKRNVGREKGGAKKFEVQAQTLSPYDQVRLKEKIRMVRKALAGLNPGQQEIILLKNQEEWTFKQIGAKYGLTDEAARKRYERAMDQLRYLIQSYTNGSSYGGPGGD